jgi:peptidoglycan/xylan/chitin deacetylase (PgdA/CDA1 family)
MPLTTAAKIDAYPGTGFEAKPAYIPKDVIIPTLDDVPDGADSSMAKTPGRWTTADLQYLDMNNMHWDFFINTNNACKDVTMMGDSGCVAAIVDILTLHNPGNHTVHHAHLAGNPNNGDPYCTNATCVGNELTGVESAINTFSKGGRPHLTRFRAPFGEPYQAGTLGYVQPEVAKFAVSIGWNLDSGDSLWDNGTMCTDMNGTPAACPTGQEIADAVTSQIKTPGTGTAYGIVLMHGIFGWTHDAIKILFDPATGYVAKNKFRIGTVEDAICWKYGKHSWEIVQTLTMQPRSPN